MAFNAAVISERRPTSQRDRALEELDALLKGPKDRDGALTHLKEVTNSFIEKAAKKAGCRAALAPPSPTPGYVAPPAAAPSPPPRPPAPVIPRRRSCGRGREGAAPPRARAPGSAGGHRRRRATDPKRAPSPEPPAYPAAEYSESASAFSADSDDDDSSASELASDGRDGALRAVFRRSRGPRNTGEPFAGAVAAALEADAAATDAWGPRAVALASGFLKTLGEDRCDYDTLREIVEKSAGAAR
ncbi:hypothetical protein JL720_2064 [Aureococcus anophagefferens]|nr:hypothetical protein JL720_2064 [Aureococcus anophagefferens]